MNKKMIGKMFLSMFVMMLCFSVCAYAYTDDEVIKQVQDKDIMQGTNIGFEPEKTLTRAEITTIVIRMKDMETDAITACNFSDVDKEYWAYNYISIATKEGITKGTGENLFSPDREVTISETVTMLLRAVADQEEIEKSGKWPDNYMNYAKKYKLLDGITKGKNDVAQRIDTARIITNILNSKYWSQDEADQDINPVYEDEDGAIIKSKAACGVIVSLATMADHNNEVELAVPGKIVTLYTPDDELKPGVCLPGTYVTFWLSGTRMWDLTADEKVTDISAYHNMAKVINLGDGVVRMVKKKTVDGSETVTVNDTEYIDANTIIFLACDEIKNSPLNEQEEKYLKEFEELRLGNYADIELCDDYNESNMTYDKLSGTEVYYQSYIDKKGNEVIVSMIYVKD
ncbi:MAG: S-layer homology domain-containing protein [Clostridia bacterium]|nr:S-layer homology domain-containing protein [Clostridia bacterium]